MKVNVFPDGVEHSTLGIAFSEVYSFVCLLLSTLTEDCSARLFASFTVEPYNHVSFGQTPKSLKF